jgi:SAM-dependent methyltransferase
MITDAAALQSVEHSGGVEVQNNKLERILRRIGDMLKSRSLPCRKGAMQTDSPDMISYYRDTNVVTEYHEGRYGGAVGRWFLESEQVAFRAMAADLGDIHMVLDIGTGTGKLRPSLRTDSFVGLDSSLHMLGVSRKMWGEVPHVLGDSIKLPFLSDSIDLVVASRVLMHVPNWSQMIAEACRVATRAVLLDYPTRPSVAAMEPSMWRWTRGRNAPPVHRIFAQSEVDEAFGSAGFECTNTRKGYLLPYRLHRILRSSMFSARMEGTFSRIGLTKRYGSPTFALYQPSGEQ